MIDLLILLAWTGSGTGIAATLTTPGESRWAWTPMAAILGPLWVAVALDQRSERVYLRDGHRADRQHRSPGVTASIGPQRAPSRRAA